MKPLKKSSLLIGLSLMLLTFGISDVKAQNYQFAQSAIIFHTAQTAKTLTLRAKPTVDSVYVNALVYGYIMDKIDLPFYVSSVIDSAYRIEFAFNGATKKYTFQVKGSNTTSMVAINDTTLELVNNGALDTSTHLVTIHNSPFGNFYFKISVDTALIKTLGTGGTTKQAITLPFKGDDCHWFHE